MSGYGLGAYGAGGYGLGVLEPEHVPTLDGLGYGDGFYGLKTYGGGAVGVPSPEVVAARLGKTVDAIDEAYLAELDDQVSRCRVQPYSYALAEALVRRVQRNLAMRNVPLGVIQDEAGGIRIGWQDPEVRRLEGPYRKVTVG